MTKPNSNRPRLAVPCTANSRAVIVSCVLLLLFTTLAIRNIVLFDAVSRFALIASVVFILGAMFVIWGQITYEGGLRRLFLILLGSFSSRHFAEVTDGDESQSGQADQSGLAELRFGYELRNKPYYTDTIPCGAVSSVEWATGQGSYLAGHDMDDWHVIIWFHDTTGKKRLDPDLRSEDLLIIGQIGPRTEVEEFGKRFVKFLQAAGVALIPTDDVTEYSSTGKRKRLPRASETASSAS